MLIWWVALAWVVATCTACPHHCSCFTDPDGYKSANCSTLALDGNPAVSTLDLVAFQSHVYGYPTKLVPRAFAAFGNVKFLWAVNCSVLTLPNDVFKGLDYLIRLDLSHNKIRHLNGGVFKNLGSLHILLLKGNPLALTPWDVIVSDTIQEIDMGQCGLRSIPHGTFISAPRLSRLSLEGNELHTFTFNQIPAGLRYVNLARNHIANVPTDVLTAMSYLRKLDLSKNPINCTCNLLIMQDWFSGQGIIFENGVVCLEPRQYVGQQLSRINENELCTLEEVKRHRRINDIQSYRDSKSHRTHNMIHDPDLQADQPNGELYSEVLFRDEGTRGLTHMEMTDKHFVHDLSDDNKLADSKHELTSTEVELASPTQEATSDAAEETSSEDLMQFETPSFGNHTEAIQTSGEDFLFLHHSNNTSSAALEVDSLLHSTETDYSNISSEESSSTNSHQLSFFEHSNETQPTAVTNDELADEGYSPVHNLSDILTMDEEGSGYSADTMGTSRESHQTKSFSEEQQNGTTEAETFTFPSSSSQSDAADYTYDTQHDYSGETTAYMTTESYESAEVVSDISNHTSYFSSTETSTDISENAVSSSETTFETFEGSGEADNETTTMISAIWSGEDNETSTDSYIILENATNWWSSTTEESTSENNTGIVADWYDGSSSQDYSSSSSSYDIMNETVTTDLPVTDVFVSSSETSGSSSSSDSPYTSSSASYTDGEIDFPSSSSEEPATSHEPSTDAEMTTLPVILTDREERTSPSSMPEETTPTSPSPSLIGLQSTPSLEVEVISERSRQVNEKIVVDPTTGLTGDERGRLDTAQSTLSYVIIGLLIALIIVVMTTIVCRKLTQMRPCSSKKKVRLPTDAEATLGTEMQDMLLPKPPENGVKIISPNGTANGKEMKEEEIPVLQKDWDEKQEPIETVTARLSMLAGPQTPVFIHKTHT